MDEPSVIWSGEHFAYWRANASGYCSNIHGAGVYEREDAERRTRHCGPEKKIKIFPVRMVTIHVPELTNREPAP